LFFENPPFNHDNNKNNYTHNLKAAEKFKQDYPGIVENCIGTAGFSLGELTSLVFAGAFTFEDGLRLVKVRAEEMHKASEQTTGGLMTVILGRDGTVDKAALAAREYCILKGIDENIAECRVSNYLFPHCKVIGGHKEALNFIEKNGKDFGIKRCKRINASGAFHTRLMQPAVQRFKDAIYRTPISVPTQIPVYSNNDGLPYFEKNEIRFKLGEQLTSAVKWEQIMFSVFTREKDEEHPWIFECGPGTNLISILKNINARAYLKAKHIDV
jgi:[acyl-carrier-protein] S-malonyltransferase